MFILQRRLTIPGRFRMHAVISVETKPYRSLKKKNVKLFDGDRRAGSRERKRERERK